MIKRIQKYYCNYDLKNYVVGLLLLTCLTPLTACASIKDKQILQNNPTVIASEISTVPNVEIESYIGLWYEYYRIENNFQDKDKGDGICFNTTAEYTVLANQKIGVKNTCYRNSTTDIAKARAKIVKGSNNAKLKVNFTGSSFLEWLGIGNGKYWILALGPINQQGLYSWALVGEPKLKYGWLLSRTTELPDQEVVAAFKVAKAVGYDLTKFKSFRR